jgi:hypothetical protein
MASTSIHVADTWVALNASGGPFPGSFSPDGTCYRFPRVSTQDSRGGTRHWEITVQLKYGPGAGAGGGEAVRFNSAAFLAQPVTQLALHYAVVESNSWHDGGEVRKGVVPTIVAVGKNLGKKNATNVATQALRDALGLYNKQMKAGGTMATAATAATGATGATGATAASASATAATAPPGRGTAPLGPLPMLVKKLDETVDARLTLNVFRQGVTVQRKLNGTRMVAFPANIGAPDVVLYSRTGRATPGKPTIRVQLSDLLSKTPEAWSILCAAWKSDPWPAAVKALGLKTPGPCPRPHLDGELYKHGKTLMDISGASRRAAKDGDLQFWIFDCFFPELVAGGFEVPSATRQFFLDTLFSLGGADKPNLGRVQNIVLDVSPLETPPPEGALTAMTTQVHALAAKFLKEGFEGAIVRKNWTPYKYGTNGYHSSNLIKIKPIHDAEFTVVGYTQGVRGKDVGAFIWECVVPAARSVTGKDETFRVVPKNMTYPMRYHVYSFLNEDVGGLSRFDRDFKGRPLTVEYPELSSKTGIPTQAKALGFRMYEPAPGARDEPDPVLRLLEDHPLPPVA